MQSEEISHRDFLERRYPTPRVVRTFGPWQVLSSAGGGRFWLLLVNHSAQEVVVCEYRTLFERQHDIEMLRRIGAADGAARVVNSADNTPPTPPATPPMSPPSGTPGANALPSPGWEDV